MLLSSCKTLNETDIYGEYVFEEMDIFHQIVITDKGVFSYSSSQGLIKPVSKGTWEFKNDSIRLNSYEEYKSGYIDLLKNDISDRISIVTILDSNGNIISDRSLLINDNLEKEYKTNKDGEVLIPEKLTSVSVLTNSGYYKYNFNDEEYYKTTLKIIPENLDHFYFKDEGFRIKRNLLVSKEGLKYKKK